MNTYKLTWTPSVDVRATQQNVSAIINGTAVAVLNPAVFDNTVASFEFAFSDDAVVEFFVTTENADASLTIDSAHFTFTATDQTPAAPLVPATGLGSTFVSHA